MAHPPSRSLTGMASLSMAITAVDLLQVFDPTESAGVGLLDEMSHMETKARLEANRRHRAKAEAERRKDIIIERAERQADLRERQALLSRRCPPQAASTPEDSPGTPCPQLWAAFVAAPRHHTCDSRAGFLALIFCSPLSTVVVVGKSTADLLAQNDVPPHFSSVKKTVCLDRTES